MKKILLFLFTIMLFCSLAVANDMQQPVNLKKAIPSVAAKNLNVKTSVLDNPTPPNWEFTREPTQVGVINYYDYMPGSYSNHPIQVQPGENGGVWMEYHGRASASTNRRMYYGYVPSEPGSNISAGTIISFDRNQGYGSVAVHPATGNPIYTWHESISGSGEDISYGITYDTWDLLHVPGFTQSPLYFGQPEPYTKEFNWPYVYVGPSPEAGNVRVYQMANAAGDNEKETVLLRHCDLKNEDCTQEDFAAILDIANWSNPVEVFTEWPVIGETRTRPYASFVTDWENPGHVALMGYLALPDEDMVSIAPKDPGFYVWESFDYGDTWDLANYHSYPDQFDEKSVWQIENTPGFVNNEDNLLPHLDVNPGYPGSAFMHKTAVIDNQNRIHMPAVLFISYSAEDGSNTYTYFPYLQWKWQVDISYDFNTGEWKIQSVPQLPGFDASGKREVPFSIGEDDSVTTYPWLDICTSSQDDGAPFHHNLQQQAVNQDNGWMVQSWVSGTKMLLADNPDVYPDADPSYVGHPIIHVSASANNGDTWSDPIELSDIHSTKFPAFSEQITVYAYIAPVIKDLGNGWGEVYMMYYNDNDYGSSVHQQGPASGGYITYTSFKIDFSTLPEQSIDIQPEINTQNLHLMNCPNPSIGSTVISYNLPHGTNSIVSIYNTRGQLVTSMTTNENTVTWNGTDSKNMPVQNGVYFYKVESKFGNGINKMILMR